MSKSGVMEAIISASAGHKESCAEDQTAQETYLNTRPGLVTCAGIPLLSLLSWIEIEVDRVVPLPAGKPLARRAAVERFRKTLSLLCYAYSTGLSRSMDVAAASGRNPSLRARTGDTVPFPHELKAFRRQHRRLLEVLLTRLFMRAMIAGRAGLDGALPPDLRSHCASQASAILNLARHLDTCDDC